MGCSHLIGPCPYHGSTQLEETDTPEASALTPYTQVSVPTPQFAEDAPYITAIASFGPVDVTGILNDTASKHVDIGNDVTLTVDQRESHSSQMAVSELV